MLGTFRFILAYLVFSSHFPGYVAKLNLGITSVIIFYFISGHLMMKSYARFKKYSPTPVRSFYIDRCIKIFPQYLIVLALTVICFKFLGPSGQNTYESVSFETTKIIFDALLIPLNFATGSIGDLYLNIGSRAIIPPAWSLSVEFNFYLMVPLLVLITQKKLLVVTITSGALLTFSIFSENPYLGTYNFGYRYIATMLVVFIFGMLSSSTEDRDKKATLLIWAYFVTLFIIVLPPFTAWYQFAVQEIIIGIVIALPLFHFFMNFKTQNKWLTLLDRWLGDLSYPIFLSHILGIYLAQHLFGVSPFAKIYFMAGSILIFLFISSLLALLQRYIDSKRIELRGFNSMISKSKT